ncbi:MAG: DUF4112 domain-containing protein [Pirellulaceae bacterium]|nr:DUF4112 domain-containing protein [Pirellulaceae bacterium]
MSRASTPRILTGQTTIDRCRADTEQVVVQPNDSTPWVDDLSQTRRRLESLAWLLDESVRIPGFGFRVGLDGILGLIPGIGDLLTTALSAFIIRQAALLGVPRIVLLRMAFNTSIDFVIGAIPFVGDLFDFGWKANKQNIRLLIKHLDNPVQLTRTSWLAVIGLTSGVLLALVVLVTAVASLIRMVRG